MESQTYYKDLNEWLNVLNNSGMLYNISRPVLKETEIVPLVKLQYRALPEDRRKGFVFSNVKDAKGRNYEAKVATGVYASSLKMYAMGLQCEPSRTAIGKKWEKAQLEPIEPMMVSSAPVQDVVYSGSDLLIDGKGVEMLPIPVELPGFSGQIRTSTYIITRTPEGDWVNMGNYSAHVFGKTKILWDIAPTNHGRIQWNMWRKLGRPMPIAVVTGGPPIFFYLASAKLPQSVNELAVAGGFASLPIEVVKCKTIDLYVPAHAEFVIEGTISPDYDEPGTAYGEYTGYMALDIKRRPIMTVTAVTHRTNPTFVHIMSQFPPSESSKVRLVAAENTYLHHLKFACKLPGILDVAWHEQSQAQWCVIKIKKQSEGLSDQVLLNAAGYDRFWGKFFIVVDEDIDAHDFDSVVWALGWRVQPHRDILVIRGRSPALDPSAYRTDASHQEKRWPEGRGSSAILIDATIKYPYPPTSLPGKEHMENALRLWSELGLPELGPLKEPWYGYELGYWPKLYAEDADLIVKGDHYKIGERLEKGRAKIRD